MSTQKAIKPHQQTNIGRSRRRMQLLFVGAMTLLGLRHIMPGESSAGGALDAFCPFGGIETLWPYLKTGATLKTTNLLNFTLLIAVVGLSVVAGRAFCCLGVPARGIAGHNGRLGPSAQR